MYFQGCDEALHGSSACCARGPHMYSHFIDVACQIDRKYGQAHLPLMPAIDAYLANAMNAIAIARITGEAGNGGWTYAGGASRSDFYRPLHMLGRGAILRNAANTSQLGAMVPGDEAGHNSAQEFGVEPGVG
eukprot:scaffold537063_cov48-Prasinocladus_malaysianus.AAC.2